MASPERADRYADPKLEAATAEFAAQLSRTAPWLNSLPLDRIERIVDGTSIAAQAHRIATRFLRLQLDLEPASYPTSRVPDVPVVRPHAVGAQLSVVGTELLKTARSVDSWCSELAEQLAELARELVALRDR